MRLFLFLFVLLEGFSAVAQQRYFLPEFKDGDVYYKEGAVVEGKLNYNLLTNRMLILDGGEKRDLADINEIEYVGLGGVKFVTMNDFDFVELMVDGDKALLTLHHEGNVVRTDPMAKRYTRKGLDKLLEGGSPMPEGVEIKVDSVYFLVRNLAPKKGLSLALSRVERASHRAFTKIYSDHKPAIDQYVEEHNVDFAKLDDLTKLILFCENLSK